MWLGANLHGEPAWQRSHSVRLPDRAGAPEGLGATLTVGRAVFHLVVLPGARGRLRLRSRPAAALKEIWPVTGGWLRWPPPLALEPHDLTPLAETIARNSSFETSQAA
jgi:hypothetical protein